MAESELRAEGVDVDAFKLRLMEKVNEKREWISIEAKVKEWHESDSTLPLHEYLGMSEDEYATRVVGCPVPAPLTPIQKLRATYDTAMFMEQQAHTHVVACIEAMQGLCEHPMDEVIEAPLTFSVELNHVQPFRVCKVCGYAEEGLGRGYKLLHRFGNAPFVQRKEALALVIGRIRTQTELYQ